MLFNIVRTLQPIRYWVEKKLYNRSKNKKYPDKLRELRDIYRNKPLLIIGNGPSLNETPLDNFINIPAIGMNKIDLLFSKVKWRPSLILSSNPLVVMQNQEFYGSTKIPVFLSWKNRWLMKKLNRQSVGYYLQVNTEEFLTDFSSGVGAGATITYAAMQLAYYAGANPVILFGIDHSFAAKGPANKVVKSKEDDKSHFDPNYFGKGTMWQLPDLEFSERAYSRAKKAFEKDGRTIYDATINGKLKIFDKISVEQAIKLCEKDSKENEIKGEI